MSGRESVGILIHPQVDRDLPQLKAAREFLAKRGFRVWEVRRDGLAGEQLDHDLEPLANALVGDLAQINRRPDPDRQRNQARDEGNNQ